MVRDELPLFCRRQFDKLFVNLRPQHGERLPSGMFFQLPQPRAPPIGLLTPMKFDDAELQFSDLSQEVWEDQRGHRTLVLESNC